MIVSLVHSSIILPLMNKLITCPPTRTGMIKQRYPLLHFEMNHCTKQARGAVLVQWQHGDIMEISEGHTNSDGDLARVCPFQVLEVNDEQEDAQAQGVVQRDSSIQLQA